MLATEQDQTEQELPKSICQPRHVRALCTQQRSGHRAPGGPVNTSDPSEPWWTEGVRSRKGFSEYFDRCRLLESGESLSALWIELRYLGLPGRA